MIGEWDVAFDLVLLNPAGAITNTLNLNDTDGTTGRRYQLVPDACSTSLPVRVTQDDVPQGDGSIPHRRWRSGYSVHLAIELMIDNAGEKEAACDADLVEMLDELGFYINAMIRTGLVSGLPNARLIWTPTGQSDDRMFDRLQLSGTPTLTVTDGDIGPRVEFDLDTPYPYYIAKTQDSTAMVDGVTTPISNLGNTDFFMVAQIDGAVTAGNQVYLENLSLLDLDGNPLQIIYDTNLPGASAISGGSYVEIVFFTGTAYLNGSLANYKAGIDMAYSDFFPLIPGINMIRMTGADGTLLTNHAWA